MSFAGTRSPPAPTRRAFALRAKRPTATTRRVGETASTADRETRQRPTRGTVRCGLNAAEKCLNDTPRAFRVSAQRAVPPVRAPTGTHGAGVQAASGAAPCSPSAGLPVGAPRRYAESARSRGGTLRWSANAPTRLGHGARALVRCVAGARSARVDRCGHCRRPPRRAHPSGTRRPVAALPTVPGFRRRCPRARPSPADSCGDTAQPVGEESAWSSSR
jgi:hypothetical protein